MFWLVVAVNFNADEVRGAVSLLVESRSKALVSSVNESAETILV